MHDDAPRLPMVTKGQKLTGVTPIAVNQPILTGIPPIAKPKPCPQASHLLHDANQTTRLGPTDPTTIPK
jgi:hypothetical protein